MNPLVYARASSLRGATLSVLLNESMIHVKFAAPSYTFIHCDLIYKRREEKKKATVLWISKLCK